MEHFLFALVLIDDTLKQAISTFFKHCRALPLMKKKLCVPPTTDFKVNKCVDQVERGSTAHPLKGFALKCFLINQNCFLFL